MRQRIRKWRSTAPSYRTLVVAVLIMGLCFSGAVILLFMQSSEQDDAIRSLATANKSNENVVTALCDDPAQKDDPRCKAAEKIPSTEDLVDSVPGALGPQGVQGLQGIPGLPGDNGEPGEDGSPGPAGKDGASGQDGPPGPAGEPGAPGASGQDGAAGPAGEAGPQGTQGEPGAQGPQGEPGKDGASPFPFSFTFTVPPAIIGDPPNTYTVSCAADGCTVS